MAGKWIEIGQVPVDTGQVMVTDPCNVLAENSDGWADILRGERELTNEYGITYAYVVPTPIGDGWYPVEARVLEDGRVAEVRVRFLPDPRAG